MVKKNSSPLKHLSVLFYIGRNKMFLFELYTNLFKSYLGCSKLQFKQDTHVICFCK